VNQIFKGIFVIWNRYWCSIHPVFYFPATKVDIATRYITLRTWLIIALCQEAEQKTAPALSVTLAL
jgi:hypothetical protein